MGSSKYLVIGIMVGMAIGAFFFYSFTQFSQLSNLQTQIDQLQLENSQLRANNTALLNQILAIQTSPSPFITEKTGEAIQIQSITSTTIYVQNVGDSTVSFGATNSVFVDGVAVVYEGLGASLGAGATVSIALVTPIGAGSHTIKVTTTDGNFSQITKTFS